MQKYSLGFFLDSARAVNFVGLGGGSGGGTATAELKWCFSLSEAGTADAHPGRLGTPKFSSSIDEYTAVFAMAVV